jgi:hypothetical protein
MRRRVIATGGETPVPTEPYLDVVPKMLWITDTVGNDALVLSNVGWIVQ